MKYVEEVTKIEGEEKESQEINKKEREKDADKTAVWVDQSFPEKPMYSKETSITTDFFLYLLLQVFGVSINKKEIERHKQNHNVSVFPKISSCTFSELRSTKQVMKEEIGSQKQLSIIF